MVDALAKLRTPTPEASPLLLAVMAHLAQGLELRPSRPALHLNLRSTPPSQLIKLANAIKVPVPVPPRLYLSICLWPPFAMLRLCEASNICYMRFVRACPSGSVEFTM